MTKMTKRTSSAITTPITEAMETGSEKQDNVIISLQAYAYALCFDEYYL